MVRIEGLSLSRIGPRGRVPVLEGADLEFRRGGIGAIVGPSGCGKTSLINALCGLLTPSAGRVLVGGLQPSPPAARRGPGWTASRPADPAAPTAASPETAVIFQDYGLLPWKSVEANAELPLLLSGMRKAERRARVLPILEELGLAEFRSWHPKRLSGGMRQRVAIARALASEPELLLMDEPFSSLDALTRESAQDTLLALWRRRRMTVLIVTHSIEEAAFLAERTYVLEGGNPGRVAARVDRVPVPEGEPSRGGPEFHAYADAIRRALESGRSAGAALPAAEDQALRELRKSELGKGLASAAMAAILLIAGWAALAAAVRRPFLPGPAPTFLRLLADWRQGDLALHVAASAWRILLALLIALPLPAALGLAAGRSRRLDALVAPLAYVAYPVPKVAFLPVLMLFFGLGDASKVAVIALIVGTQVLVAARDAGRAVPQATIDAARSMGAGALALARHVVLPASLPALLSALRTSLGTATAVLFFAETFATERGLGYAVMDAWTRVDYPGMYAAILALSLFGLAAFAAVDLAERLFCSWREREG